jgi:hypothetical protein
MDLGFASSDNFRALNPTVISDTGIFPDRVPPPCPTEVTAIPDDSMKELRE